MLGKDKLQCFPAPKSIVVIACLAVIAFLSLSGLLAYQALLKTEYETAQEINSTLDNVLETTHESLKIWEKKLTNDINQIAHNSVFSSLIEKQLSSPSENNLKKINDHYQTMAGLIDGTGFSIITRNNTTLATFGFLPFQNDTPESQNFIQSLQKVINGQTIFIPPTNVKIAIKQDNGDHIIHDSPMLFVATPIYGRDNTVIAALAVSIDPHKTFSEITSLGRPGKTGKTYALDKGGKILNVQQLINQDINHDMDVHMAFHKLQSHITPDYLAQAILQSRHSAQYTHYTTDDVYGSLIWNDEIGIGLATEIDRTEAMQQYNRSADTIIIFFLATAIAAIIIFGITINTNILANITLKKKKS